jgi:CHAD domain-containing protein
MTKKTTTTDVQRHLDAAQAALKNLSEPRILRVGYEHHLPFYGQRTTDLTELDVIREHSKRYMANQIADELLRSGSIEFNEELEDNFSRMTKTLRVTAKVKLAA